MAKKTEGLTNDEKLDMMVYYLRRMDHRDKLRTWGGFVQSLVRIGGMVFFVYITWWSIVNADVLIDKVASAAAKQAANIAGQSTSQVVNSMPDDLTEQIQQMLQKR